MSKKKNKKQVQKETYILCITVGLFIGVGLGPVFDSVLFSALGGAILGAGAGYFFNHLRNQK
ncbi:MAG: hypothetical protein MI746_07200 [Pseudomonadales bacterium]|nr:hypothetical protein [Pseudomonadales bacterium]